MTRERALSDVRVLEVANFLAGPFVGTLLAEFGADVIKVEQPGVGDPFRRFGTKSPSGDSLFFMSENRNKRSVTLDLKKPEGAALLKRLVRQADVLCENFQPGTMERWGLGWDVLHEINPRLVMVRISGYGQTGPYSDRPGFGRIANAFGGLSFLAGYPDRPPVTPGSATIADYLSGMFGAFGALVALKARERTGEGQMIDIGLYETVFRILDELTPAFGHTGFVRQRMGPGTVNAVPHSHFPTKDGRWVAIACTNDKIFARLAELMGHPELAGNGIYGTIGQREAAREEVDATVTAWSSTLTRDEILAACGRAQVPCGMVAAIDEIFADPHYAARRNIVEIADPRGGPIAVPGVVPVLSATPGSIESLAPALGSHNDEVYGGLLGLSEDERKKLAGLGVI
jgi:crotonobetainyl-CoA:carnitine CoA-transferase CaiB-like acyl-CoA transferase